MQKKKVENHVGEKKNSSKSSGCKKKLLKIIWALKKIIENHQDIKKILPRFARHQFIQTSFHKNFSASLRSAWLHSKLVPQYLQCCTICKTFKYIPFKYHRTFYWHCHWYCCCYCYCPCGTFIISEWNILFKEYYYAFWRKYLWKENNFSKESKHWILVLLHMYHVVNTKL